MRETLRAVMDEIVKPVAIVLAFVCAVVAICLGLHLWGVARGENAAMKAELGRTVEIKVYGPEGTTASARDWFKDAKPNYAELEKDRKKHQGGD